MSATTLKCVSDRDLIGRLQRLVVTERKRIVDILRHLNEVERRRLHLRMGYSSLYDYCVSRLRYSRSAADRRIVAARALRRAPRIAAMLTAGDASLTTIAMAGRIMTPENADSLLRSIRGKSQRQVEVIVAAYRPERKIPDRVRAIPVRERNTQAPSKPAVMLNTWRAASGRAPGTHQKGDGLFSVAGASGSATTPGKNGTCGEDAKYVESRSRPNRADGGEIVPADQATHAVVVKHEIRFVAGKEFMDKLERVRVLTSNRISNASFEQVFDAAMDAFLDDHCPIRRSRRREKRASAPEKARARNPLPAPGVKSRRHIPAAIRDHVHRRDGGRCTWVGRSGHQCGSRTHLQIDHIVPFGHGGTHTPSNLRLLCRAHNLLAAEHAYGRDVMARYARYARFARRE